MSGFQKTVNSQQAPAVAGDFASANPRASVLAGEGGLVAGFGGVTVGKFAWVDPADGKTVYSHGVTNVAPSGFVHREQQSLITAYLGESSNLVPAGFGVTLHNEGDFWALLTGANAAAIGDAIYADSSTGDVLAKAAPTAKAATGSDGATFTATGTGTSLAASAVTGLISIGDTVAGTGVPAGTTIVAQVSGTTGGAGTYTTSQATTISAATATAYGNKLNVSAVSAGVLEVGDVVSGTGIPSGATITGQISGATGGVGVYTISAPATAYAASTVLTVAAGVLTAWKAQSNAAVGELVKISTWG